MMDWDNKEWLSKRQAEYDKRVSAYGLSRTLRTHDEIVREIDLLPYEQGGRKLPDAAK